MGEEVFIFVLKDFNFRMKDYTVIISKGGGV